MSKIRADRLIVEQGLAESRQKAQALIMSGAVFGSAGRLEKPGQLVDSSLQLTLKKTIPFVSRGGLKLAEALAKFELDVSGKTAADLGASTGGFSDCLLQHGAHRVYSVDVDTRQLDWTLRQDERIVPVKKNARYLEGADFPDPIDVFTVDLAFISVLKVLPALPAIPGEGQVLALIKPQFEVGKGEVGKKGIVRDRNQHQAVLTRVTESAEQMGYFTHKVMAVSVRGQKGNQEFFVFWLRQPESGGGTTAAEKIREAVWNEKD